MARNNTWLTTTQAAALLEKSRNFVWARVRDGYWERHGIRVRRIGRWHELHREDLMKYKETVEAATRSGSPSPPL